MDKRIKYVIGFLLLIAVGVIGYTAPAYNSMNFTLSGTQDATTYNSLNFSLTDAGVDNTDPNVTNLNWITTGGFTDDTLTFNQVLDYINATCQDETNLSSCNLTVLLETLAVAKVISP